MFRDMIVIFVGLVCFVFLSGCQGRVDEGQGNGNLTHGMVVGGIVKGETRQADILEMFGGPNVMTTNKSGRTVWSYHRVSSSSGGKGENLYLFLYGSGGFEQHSRVKSFTCIITFDDADVVVDYQVRTSQY